MSHDTSCIQINPALIYQNASHTVTPHSKVFSLMRWIKPHLKSSLLGLLNGGEVTSFSLEKRTEGIRQMMLNELGNFGEKHYPKITLRVRYAQDAQGLWYARSDVMAVLSAMQGETIARQKVSRITQMFEGLLPGGLGSRRSSLTN
jgi:hypothetical protein